jgi:hypothetical protein
LGHGYSITDKKLKNVMEQIVGGRDKPNRSGWTIAGSLPETLFITHK